MLWREREERLDKNYRPADENTADNGNVGEDDDSEEEV